MYEDVPFLAESQALGNQFGIIKPMYTPNNPSQQTYYDMLHSFERSYGIEQEKTYKDL